MEVKVFIEGFEEELEKELDILWKRVKIVVILLIYLKIRVRIMFVFYLV